MAQTVNKINPAIRIISFSGLFDGYLQSCLICEANQRPRSFKVADYVHQENLPYISFVIKAAFFSGKRFNMIIKWKDKKIHLVFF